MYLYDPKEIIEFLLYFDYFKANIALYCTWSDILSSMLHTYV